jgi:uncharacterized protein YggT (Ycf19 family)
MTDGTPTRHSSGNRTMAYRLAKGLILFLYGVLIIAEVLLVMTFFLQLFNASESASFTQWVYRSSARVLAPFRGIFPTIEGQHGSVLDFSVLFAMLIYGMLAMGAHSLIAWLDRKLAAQRWKAAVEERERAELRSQTNVYPEASGRHAAPSAPPPPSAGPHGRSRG